MKTHPITGTRCSTEDLADDEREDTSEAEQEPEPDYDDEPLGRQIYLAENITDRQKL